MKNHNQSNIPRIMIGIMVMALAVIACALPVNEPTPTLSADVLPTQAALPTASQAASTAPPTQEATSQTTQAPTVPAQDRMEFKGVSFAKLPGLFSDAKAQIVPLEAGDPTAPGWPGPVPEYYLFELEGYPLSGTFHRPQIMVFPILDYAAVNPPAGEIAKNLEDELNLIEVNYKNQPFLPMWNAGQVFYVNANIQPFGSGKGVRYMTCYSQAIVPIDNQCVFYTYQALTADGKYYVAAIFPINLPALDQAEIKQLFEDSYQDGKKYEAYVSKAIALVRESKATDFNPNLDQLDELLKSLVVEPSVTLQAPPKPQYTCAGSMAVRLKPGMTARVTYTDGTPLRVRQDAGKSAKILTTLQEGAAMTILEGPRCLDKGAWWRMQNDAQSVTGWVLEGENGVYYVEPQP